jgi:type IV pilus assembly protein PilB
MPLLEEKLAELKKKEKEDQAKQKAEKFNLPYLDLKFVPIETEALPLIKEIDSKKWKMAAIKKKGKQIWLVALNPDKAETKKAIKDLEKKGYKINLFVCSESSLEKAWAAYRRIPQEEEKKITGIVEIGGEFLEKTLKKIKTLADIKQEIERLDNSQTSAIVEILLAGGLQTDASDIHLETTEDKTEIRYRIDGILQDAAFLSPKTYILILNRIKLLAGMKLNVRNQAQDGRFTVSIDGAEIEVRVSVIPSSYGENIVMRILNPKSINLKLEDLGMRPDLLQILEKEIQKPNGMLITTGPTGSGKTTLLYAIIRKVNTPEVKIITLEDPVEYHLEGITQTQVEASRGYTFAKGLRAILRQDPDMILVGEIRDNETAAIAVQSALTGHLVFSTLHTNDAAGAIPRFLDIGVNASNLSAALNLIIAQRLVRRLCDKCKKETQLSPTELSKIKKEIDGLPDSIKKPDKFTIYQATGCPQCNQTGYKGRIGIFELILVNEEMEKLINGSPGHLEIIGQAKKQGMVNLYQDGLLKVVEGMTTLEELKRTATE